MAEVNWDDRALKRLMRERVLTRLEKLGAIMENSIKKSFKKGTGKLYKRGKKSHRASAPGKAPAVDTGQLRSSISSIINRKKLRLRVGSNLKKALKLEFGTSLMEARPFLRPALARGKKVAKILFKGQTVT